MGQLIEGDDGLLAEEVGAWVKEKHSYLCRYVDISREARKGWLRPGKAGATYVDLFCGPGRCRIRETGEWIDGGALAAWRTSQEGGAPFSRMFVGDLDPAVRSAHVARLKKAGAPVAEVPGTAAEAVSEVVKRLDPYGLHLAFLDPYKLEPLDFDIIKRLSALRRIDMLIHVSKMDLQRNMDRYTDTENGPLDTFAPGWRNVVNPARTNRGRRQEYVAYWHSLVKGLGVWPSDQVRLVTGSRSQPLYWLLIAAKHPLAHQIWSATVSVASQGWLEGV